MKARLSGYTTGAVDSGGSRDKMFARLIPQNVLHKRKRTKKKNIYNIFPNNVYRIEGARQ